MGNRVIKYFDAIREATDLTMQNDPSVFVIGLGVPDPKGIFGTTLGLQEKYGTGRVMDMPCSENGMTGVAIGSALVGMRPILTHQRVDFALLSMEQIVNQAAKWHYMFAGQMKVPLVIRLIIGRGWGQGPQHSQSLESWFAHIPGLKVVMPTTPYDAKGLLIASIEDNNPVIFLEHRWLHNISGYVPEEMYRVPIGKSKILRKGRDITLVATSYMTLEALRAQEYLNELGIEVEVIDLRTLRPLDDRRIISSVKKTGRLLVCDTGWTSCGISSEIIARVTEKGFLYLTDPPQRLGLPDVPTPTSPALSNYYYPQAESIIRTVLKMLKKKVPMKSIPKLHDGPLDVPDMSFSGPF
jgi:pyruvate dehydrogenase E1 component beta subunit